MPSAVSRLNAGLMANEESQTVPKNTQRAELLSLK